MKPYWGYMGYFSTRCSSCPNAMSVQYTAGSATRTSPSQRWRCWRRQSRAVAVASPRSGGADCSTNQQPVMTFLGQNPTTERVLYIVEGGSSAATFAGTPRFRTGRVSCPGSAFTVVTASAPKRICCS